MQPQALPFFNKLPMVPLFKDARTPEKPVLATIDFWNQTEGGLTIAWLESFFIISRGSTVLLS